MAVFPLPLCRGSREKSSDHEVAVAHTNAVGQRGDRVAREVSVLEHETIQEAHGEERPPSGRGGGQGTLGEEGDQGEASHPGDVAK